MPLTRPQLMGGENFKSTWLSNVRPLLRTIVSRPAYMQRYSRSGRPQTSSRSWVATNSQGLPAQLCGDVGALAESTFHKLLPSGLKLHQTNDGMEARRCHNNATVGAPEAKLPISAKAEAVLGLP